MKTKIVYQYDLAGRYVGQVDADESPREPDVFLLPARTTETPPPASWPDDVWPRWVGDRWELTGAARPDQQAPADPLEKLQVFLASNPDVAALLEQSQPKS